MSEKKIAWPEGDSDPGGRYEVQFQKDSHRHSDTNDLEQATLYARSLANWNLAAQVYDRVTRKIVFRAAAYASAVTPSLPEQRKGSRRSRAYPAHEHSNSASRVLQKVRRNIQENDRPNCDPKCGSKFTEKRSQEPDVECTHIILRRDGRQGSIQQAFKSAGGRCSCGSTDS